MNLESLRNRAADLEGSSNLKTLSEDSFSFELKFEDASFAWYVIENPSRVPQDFAQFASKQEERIGKVFMAAKGNLQWNLYYYIVLNDSDFANPERQLLYAEIERDKRFARKRVLSESMIESVFPFSKTISVRQVRETPQNLIDIWKSKIPEDFSEIFGGPKQLRFGPIREQYYNRETRPEPKKQPRAKSGKQADVRTIKHISTITLQNYRPHPTERNFLCGKMTLLDGVNGVGKTSLLEAIEIAMCGNSRRPSADLGNYQIDLATSDEGPQVSFPTKETYADRQRIWYSIPAGQGRANILTLFTRYNFFNTDAAFDLSKNVDKESLESAIDSIVVGPEAGLAQDRINRFLEEFESDIERFNAEIVDLALAQEADADELRRLKGSAQDTRIDVGGLSNEFAILQYQVPEQLDISALRTFQLSLSNALANLTPLLKSFGHLSLPSIEGIESFISATSKDNQELIQLRTQQDQNSLKLKDLNAKDRDQGQLLERVRRMLQYQRQPGATKLPELSRRSGTLKNQVRQFDDFILTSQLNDVESRFEHLILESNSIENLITTRTSEKSREEKELADLKKDIAALEQKRQSFADGLNQLRSLGLRLVESRQLNDCPLCNHTHTYEKLRDLLKGQVQTIDDDWSHLLEKKTGLETSIQRSLVILTDLRALSVIAEHLKSIAGMVIAASPKEIVEAAKATIVRRSEIMRELTSIEEALNSLSAEGYSLDEFDQLCSLNSSLPANDVNSWEQFVLSLETQSADRRKEIDELKSNHSDNITKHDELRKRVNERLANVMSLAEFPSIANSSRSVLKELSLQFPNLARESDLRTLESAARKAIQFMESATKALEEGTIISQRISELETATTNRNSSLENLKKRCTRANEARDLFKNVVTNENIAKFTRHFFQENIETIQKIFVALHSPSEFNRITFDPELTLWKQDQKFSLHEISTGQRSALALSVFLGLHLSCPTAPKFLIFDDPISFIDDLNVLSFLDLLRELVVTMDRQIFFATANAKLSALIRKKFEFLGENIFVAHVLSRESASALSEAQLDI